MGRGVSSGGGQSSLDYLFGGGEPSKSAADNSKAAINGGMATISNGSSSKLRAASKLVDVNKQIPAGIQSSAANNVRADGQKAANFITERPSTKVHAAPGGGSSLGYLFGDGIN